MHQLTLTLNMFQGVEIKNGKLINDYNLQGKEKDPAILRYYIGDSYAAQQVPGAAKKQKGVAAGLDTLGLAAVHEDESEFAGIVGALPDANVQSDFFGDELDAVRKEDEVALLGMQTKSKFRWAQPGASSMSSEKGAKGASAIAGQKKFATDKDASSDDKKKTNE